MYCHGIVSPQCSLRLARLPGFDTAQPAAHPPSLPPARTCSLPPCPASAGGTGQGGQEKEEEGRRRRAAVGCGVGRQRCGRWGGRPRGTPRGGPALAAGIARLPMQTSARGTPAAARLRLPPCVVRHSRGPQLGTTHIAWPCLWLEHTAAWLELAAALLQTSFWLKRRRAATTVSAPTQVYRLGPHSLPSMAGLAPLLRGPRCTDCQLAGPSSQLGRPSP